MFPCRALIFAQNGKRKFNLVDYFLVELHIMRKLILPLIASLTVCGAASASAVVLDFEGLQTGEIVNNQFNPFVTVSATGGAGQAIIFDTNNPTGGDYDLVVSNTLSPSASAPAGGNVLIIAERLTDSNNDGFVDVPDDNGRGGTITFDFAQAVDFLGFNGIDFTDGRGFLQVDLFSGAANIFSFLIDDNAGSNPNILADVGDNIAFGLFENVFGADGVSGVTSAQITLGGSGAIDGLDFAVSEVPVPAALPLMLSALGFGGFVSRRRKAKLARAV